MNVKIENKTDLLVLAKTETANRNDPSVKYYKLLCMQNAVAFESNVNVDVFNQVKEQTKYTFITEYAKGESRNGGYEYFRILGLAK